MKNKILTLLLALSLGISAVSVNAVSDNKAKASAAGAELPDRAVSRLTDYNLEGYVGKRVQDHIENWEKVALNDNPNIVYEINNAAKGLVSLGALMSDPFQVHKYYGISLSGVGGFSGKAVKYTYKNATNDFADLDFLISKDASVRTDCRGAEELWYYVNASEFGTKSVPIRVNVEEGEPNTGVRESWTPKANVTVQTIADGASARTPMLTDKDGYTVLPAGFKGWVCFPFNTESMNMYWSSGETNKVLDKQDVHQFMINVKANPTALNQSLYLDEFSVVGSELSYKEGVTGLPLNVEGMSGKEFRRLWSVDNIDDIPFYQGAVVPWYGEFPGKLLTGMVFSYKISPDEELLTAIETLAASLTAAQGKDGYIGTYVTNRYNLDFDGNWDLWNHYHVVYGLYNWYLISGDKEALKTCTKTLDYIIKVMKDRNNESYATKGAHEMNLAIGHTFALLYQETGNKKYLDACNQMFDYDWERTGEWFSNNAAGKDFYKSKLPRWEALHPISMLSVLYEVTGDKKFYDCLEDIFYSIAKTDRHNTGGFSSGEGARGTPYLSGAGAEIETCCTIAWMALSTEYLQVSNNPEAADELELSYLNGMLGSVVGDDAKYVTYNTPMIGLPTRVNNRGYNGKKIASTIDIDFQYNIGSPDFTCCQANASRGVGQLSEWGVLTDKKSIYVNYYGPSAANTLTPGGKAITLEQVTEYPKDGKITLKIKGMEGSETFGLKLRIPGWAKQNFVKVKGDADAVAVRSGQYYEIKRAWKNDDEIEINLDMSVHFWKGEKGENFEDYTSVYYGPILMTLDEQVAIGKTNQNTKFNARSFVDVIIDAEDAAKDGHWLYFDVKDTKGEVVRLVDFASCGQYEDGDPMKPGNYYTWLQVADSEMDIIERNVLTRPIWHNMLQSDITASSEVVIDDKANAGDLISFYVNETEGKKVDKVIVTTPKGNIVVEMEDGGYNFEMPNGNATVSVTFVDADESSGCGGEVNAVNAAAAVGAAAGLAALAFVKRKKKASK